MKFRNPQAGYALLIILLLVTLMAIALAAAVPAIKTQIRREQEIELQHRGDQYVRAIAKYYHKFGRYPSSIEQLENTNNIRFLRKRYKDPVTGKDDWRMIHLGEAKYPPKIKALGGSQVGQSIGTSIGANIGQNVGALNSGAAGNAAGGAQNYNGASNQTGAPSLFGNAQAGQSPGGLGASAGSGLANDTGSGVGQSGQPVIGVAIPNTQESLKVYNERKKYNEWEFIYDPRIEALKNSGANGIGGGVPGGLPGGQGAAGPGGPFQITPNQGNTGPLPSPQPNPR